MHLFKVFSFLFVLLIGVNCESLWSHEVTETEQDLINDSGALQRDARSILIKKWKRKKHGFLGHKFNKHGYPPTINIAISQAHGGYPGYYGGGGGGYHHGVSIHKNKYGGGYGYYGGVLTGPGYGGHYYGR